MTTLQQKRLLQKVPSPWLHPQNATLRWRFALEVASCVPIPNLVDLVDTAFGPEDAHTSSVLAGGFGSDARGSYSEPCRVPGTDCHVAAHMHTCQARRTETGRKGTACHGAHRLHHYVPTDIPAHPLTGQRTDERLRPKLRIVTSSQLQQASKLLTLDENKRCWQKIGYCSTPEQ